MLWFFGRKIREESRKLIESIYADEVNQFLEKMASIVDGKGNRVVVRNGYHKSRVVQTACGNVEVKLPRVDDRKATEKFVSKILPPFARKTPTVETLIAERQRPQKPWLLNSAGRQKKVGDDWKALKSLTLWPRTWNLKNCVEGSRLNLCRSKLQSTTFDNISKVLYTKE